MEKKLKKVHGHVWYEKCDKLYNEQFNVIYIIGSILYWQVIFVQMELSLTILNISFVKNPRIKTSYTYILSSHFLFLESSLPLSAVTSVDLSETSPTSPQILTPTTWSSTAQLVPITRTNTSISESAEEDLRPPLISTNHIDLLEPCKTRLTNHIPEEVLTLTQVSGHIAQLSDICVNGNTIVGATEVDAKLLQECFSTLGLNNEETKYTLTGEGAFCLNLCLQILIQLMIW